MTKKEKNEADALFSQMFYFSFSQFITFSPNFQVIIEDLRFLFNKYIYFFVLRLFVNQYTLLCDPIIKEFLSHDCLYFPSFMEMEKFNEEQLIIHDVFHFIASLFLESFGNLNLQKR